MYEQRNLGLLVVLIYHLESVSIGLMLIRITYLLIYYRICYIEIF